MAIEEEIWKDIRGFEGYFQVSNLGRVRSVDRVIKDSRYGDRHLKGKLLKSVLNRGGYPFVTVSRNNKFTMLRIHKEVARAFIPNPDNLPVINHKDEDSTNNRVDNLEWCTQKYNCNYGTGIERCARTKWKPVDLVDSTTNSVIKTYPSQKQAAKENGISNRGICYACKTGKKYLGMTWRFSKETFNNR